MDKVIEFLKALKEEAEKYNGEHKELNGFSQRLAGYLDNEIYLQSHYQTTNMNDLAFLILRDNIIEAAKEIE